MPRRFSYCMFQLKQSSFEFYASGISGQRAATADNAVARHDDTDRIMPNGTSDSLRRHGLQRVHTRIFAGKFSVCHRMAVRYCQQHVPYAASERRPFELQCRKEIRPFTGKVTVEPFSSLCNDRRQSAVRVLRSRYQGGNSAARRTTNRSGISRQMLWS